MAVKEKISMFCHVEPEQVSTLLIVKYVGQYTKISVYFSFTIDYSINM